MRRVRTVLGLVLVVSVTACVDQSSSPSERAMPPSPSADLTPLGAYEALVRQLADPAGPKPIYVLSDLCSHLMESEYNCSDRLSREEQPVLRMRLRDMGDIVFLPHDGRPASGDLQEILLGPIEDQADGLRVEGGSLCGGDCGSGAEYRLVATEGGYLVQGTDDSYGSWIT